LISDASDITDHRFQLEQEIQELEDEKVATEQFVEHRKPYWMFLDASRGEEMTYGLFNYAPIGHYDMRIDELRDELEDLDEDLVPDGGRPRKYFWTWITEDGNLLYETELNGEEADVFYESPEEAREALERHVDRYPEREERYKKSGLYQIKLQEKEMEGVEVLTEQQGLGDFATDGGYTLAEWDDQDLLEVACQADELEW
jgi:hypothetical protein